MIVHCDESSAVSLILDALHLQQVCFYIGPGWGISLPPFVILTLCAYNNLHIQYSLGLAVLEYGTLACLRMKLPLNKELTYAK